MQEELLTVVQAAETLQVHEDKVRKLVRSGQLPGFRIGGPRGPIRIQRSDLSKALVAAATSNHN